MAHYAQVIDGRVAHVIVAEQDFIDTLPDPERWVQTSYNTRGGVHILGGTPLRGNYASIGGHYDAEHDVFYAAQPFASWSLNPQTWEWEAPVPRPQEPGLWVWEEGSLEWLGQAGAGA